MTEIDTSSADVAIVAADLGAALVADQDRALPRLVAAWLLGFGSENTRRAYSADVRAWIAFCADHGVDPLLTARRSHVDAWARTLEAAGFRPRTVGRRIASVSSWYRFLVDEEVRQLSPGQHVGRPAIGDRGETPGLVRDELWRLLAAGEASGSLRTVALLQLLATTGVRITEALSRDVEHLGHDRGRRVLKLDRKGGRGDRTVLTAPVIRALDTYVAGRTTGPLFITSTGKRMGQPEAWRMVRRIALRAALDGAGEISPHSLRVAFVTGAREAGVPLEDVQDAAGHADPRTTRRYDRGRHSLDRHASYAVTSWLGED
jgi:integrase/recombinase XerD